MRHLFILLFLFLASAAQAQLPAPAPTSDGADEQAPAAPQDSSSQPIPPIVSSFFVSVGGVSINGLNHQDALHKLQTHLSPLLQRKLPLFDGQQTFWRTRAALGASIPYEKLLHDAKWLSTHGGGNVRVRFKVDLAQTKQVMQAWADRNNQSPSHPSLSASHGNVVLNNGVGFELAIDGSAWRIKKAIEADPSQIFIDLVSRITPAYGNTDLSQFQYVIGEYITKFNPNVRGRTVNLKKSATNIDGTIVPSGAVFSANKAIGPRNASHGWKEAKMFVNGDVVDGIGAGICQSATTLYNAALLAGLPIVERHQHQFRVYYAPASRDATLYWGVKDFRFRNDTGGPIYVQTLVQNRHYIVRLYGTEPMEAKIKIESKVLSRNNGTRSKAYRITTTPSGTKRELLSRDSYLPDKEH